MSIVLHHMAVKSRHLVYSIANMLLSAILSWAAIDHLVQPKDLADIIGRFGYSTLTVLKSVIGNVPIALPGIASFSVWRHSPNAARRIASFA